MSIRYEQINFQLYENRSKMIHNNNYYYIRPRFQPQSEIPM